MSALPFREGEASTGCGLRSIQDDKLQPLLLPRKVRVPGGRARSSAHELCQCASLIMSSMHVAGSHPAIKEQCLLEIEPRPLDTNSRVGVELRVCGHYLFEKDSPNVGREGAVV